MRNRYVEAIKQFELYLNMLEDGDITKEDAKKLVRTEYRDAAKEISTDKIESLYSEAMATLFDIEAA